jgi:hypothetical protein
MEPAGLAVGIAGLAGLFSSCLEVVERFDSWKDFGHESRSLTTHYEAQKLLLHKWGQAVGFDRGMMSPCHHEALDDPVTRSRVWEHLSAIETICSTSKAISDLPPAYGADNESSEDGMRPSPPFQSKWLRVRWALRDKARYAARVEKFGKLVQDLYNLVPPEGADSTGSSKDGGGKRCAALEHMDGTTSFLSEGFPRVYQTDS